jgi:phosphate transport system substrate-binding protein
MRNVLFVSLIVAALLATIFGGVAQAAGPVQVTGAGATFPYPLYSRWFYDYAFVDNGAQFNYQSIGSGGGIQQITAKTVDFGASDAILNDAQRKAAPSLEMFPTVAGAVTVAYNMVDAAGKAVPSGLRLTPDVIADIFLGKITKWNDNRLTTINPNVQIPDKPIVVVHRSDGSGTSFLFTSYLSQVSGDWKSKVGASTSVQWPAGVGGKGNEGVAGILTQQPGSIGYVELAYAVQNKIPYAVIQNQAGKFVEPTLASTTAASDAFAAQMPADMGQLIVNAPGDASYPIAGYTFALVYADSADCTKAQKIAAFLGWALGPTADKDATDLLYAPLAASVKADSLARIAKLTCNGGAQTVLTADQIKAISASIAMTSTATTK